MILAALLTVLVALPWLSQTPAPSDATILATEFTTDLLAPASLVLEIDSDLAAIRSYDTTFVDFHASPPWELGTTLVGLSSAAWAEYQAGQYHGLDALNQQYGPVSISSIGTIALVLRFQQPYNPVALSALYGTAAGVWYAEPNFRIGAPPTDIEYAGAGRYTMIHQWGDCPSGCLYVERWEFHVESGAVTLLAHTGGGSAARPASWGQLKARFR